MEPGEVEPCGLHVRDRYERTADPSRVEGVPAGACELRVVTYPNEPSRVWNESKHALVGRLDEAGDDEVSRHKIRQRHTGGG